MSMSNYSTKENAEVDSKKKNESEIQDESKNCESLMDSLFNI